MDWSNQQHTYQFFTSLLVDLKLLKSEGRLIADILEGQSDERSSTNSHLRDTQLAEAKKTIKGIIGNIPSQIQEQATNTISVFRYRSFESIKDVFSLVFEGLCLEMKRHKLLICLSRSNIQRLDNIVRSAEAYSDRILKILSVVKSKNIIPEKILIDIDRYPRRALKDKEYYYKNILLSAPNSIYCQFPEITLLNRFKASLSFAVVYNALNVNNYTPESSYSELMLEDIEVYEAYASWIIYSYFREVGKMVIDKDLIDQMAEMSDHYTALFECGDRSPYDSNDHFDSFMERTELFSKTIGVIVEKIIDENFLYSISRNLITQVKKTSEKIHDYLQESQSGDIELMLGGVWDIIRDNMPYSDVFNNMRYSFYDKNARAKDFEMLKKLKTQMGGGTSLDMMKTKRLAANASFDDDIPECFNVINYNHTSRLNFYTFNDDIDKYINTFFESFIKRVHNITTSETRLEASYHIASLSGSHFESVRLKDGDKEIYLNSENVTDCSPLEKIAKMKLAVFLYRIYNILYQDYLLFAQFEVARFVSYCFSGLEVDSDDHNLYDKILSVPDMSEKTMYIYLPAKQLRLLKKHIKGIEDVWGVFNVRLNIINEA